jgi:hypothetical protein
VFPYINGTDLVVYDSALAKIGDTLTNISNGPLITETTYLGLPTLTMMARKSTDSLPHAYFIKDGDAAWTEITDADFPTNQATPLTVAGRMVHMDGYAFVMDTTGKIWNSDINNISSWTSTGFTTAQSSPDGGSGLAITKNIVVAFGTGSIEFFQNTGNATGSPLTRIASAAINMGSTRVGTGFNPAHIEIGDSIYFFSTYTDSSQTGVYKITGTQLQKISNPAIDKLITEGATSIVYGFAGTFKSHGMMHLMLYTGYTTVPCYCLETGVWWYWLSGDGIAVRSCVDMGDKSYLTGGSRKLYTMDAANPTYADDSSFMTMTIQTQPIDHGTDKLKSFEEFTLIGDTQSFGSINIAWSNNDYQSFNAGKTMDISVGQKQLQAGLGLGRQRIWKITDTANRPFRASAFEVEWEVAEE